MIANTNADGATCAAYTLTVSGFYDNTAVGSCAGEPPVANPDSATTPENTDGREFRPTSAAPAR